ncbi:hypothetical protein FRC01_001479, partial [Tulasnella sp. 417]
MDTSDKPSNLREVGGRLFNTTTEVRIPPTRQLLPELRGKPFSGDVADGVEHRRLDAQHQAVTTMLGGLFPAGSGADEILSQSSEGYKPRVLDIGTGSGAWVIDVAIKYPNAEVVGLDLAPFNHLSTPPPNCRFETGDASSGLKQYGRFDIIHARSVLQGIKDYASLCTDIAEVLNPQGIFISVEGEIGLYDKDKVKYGPQKEGDPDFCWAQEVTMAYLEATRKRNPGFSDLKRVEEILKATTGDPWNAIAGTTFFLPCGPYESGNETERNAGRLMHQSALKVPKALQALLLASGYDAGYVNRLTEMALDEIESCRVVNFLK